MQTTHVTGFSQLANFTRKYLFRYMDDAERSTYKDPVPDAIPCGKCLPGGA
jgi:hypothetical protein